MALTTRLRHLRILRRPLPAWAEAAELYRQTGHRLSSSSEYTEAQLAELVQPFARRHVEGYAPGEAVPFSISQQCAVE